MVDGDLTNNFGDHQQLFSVEMLYMGDSANNAQTLFSRWLLEHSAVKDMLGSGDRHPNI